MSQRVYLLPVNTELLEEYNSVVKNNSLEQMSHMKQSMIKQRTLMRFSRKCASRLSKDDFERIGRVNDYYLYTALRPYFITEDGYDISDILNQLRSGNEKDIKSIFKQQLARVGKRIMFWNVPDDTADPISDDEMNIFRELSGLRDAIVGKRSYAIQSPKLIEDDNGFSYYSQTEFMEEIIEGSDLILYYGRIIGQVFGKISGASEPSWWLGNNLWIGRLFRDDIINNDKYAGFIDIFDSLKRNCVNSSILFESIGFPGIDEAVPMTCEPYSIGLHIPADNIRPLLNDLEPHRIRFQELMSLVSGYDMNDISVNIHIIFEALRYASAGNFGLIEGDDMVGQYGER